MIWTAPSPLYMFKKISIAAVSFLLLIIQPALCQKREILYKENLAKEEFLKGDYRDALKLYLELDSLNKDEDIYNYYIAMSYINLHNSDKAMPYFEQCLSKADDYPAELHYYAGKAFHLAHRFDDAISHFETFLRKLQASGGKKFAQKNEQIIKEVNRDIEICNTAKNLIAKAEDIKIVNLGATINSKYPEYGPILSADESELIFTSTRPGTTGGQIDHSDGLGLHYEDVYISYKTDTGWSSPVNLGPPVNTIGNDASIAVSADGQKLLIYRSVKENFLSHSSGDLYISELKGKRWAEPVKLPDQINSKGWESSSSLSADQRILYFTSDREGGQGGTDIYMVRKLPHGEWAMPMNMGPVINTPYDEDSPFIHPDGKTLYFSSKGHSTMGGFDIFVSKYDEDSASWGKPENIGYPINTAHDDIHFSWTADGKKIYFSSIRPEGHGDKDIYYSEVYKESAQLVVLKGIISDSSNQNPMEAIITVRDKETQEIVGIFNSNSETGKYLVVLPEGKHYEFIFEADEFEDCIEDVSIPDIGEFEIINKNIRLCSKAKK